MPAFVERIPDASYSIYLWHVPLLAAIGLLVQSFYPSSRGPHVLALGSVFAIVVLARLRLYNVLEQPLLRAFHTRRFAGAATEPAWSSPAEVDITSLAATLGYEHPAPDKRER